MEMVGLLGKTLGMMFGIVILMCIGLIVLLDIWGKKSIEGHILGVFVENRKLYSKLLTVDAGKAYLGKGEKREEYLLDDRKQFWAGWPAGLPSLLQIPVRAHWYARNIPDPIDPQSRGTTLSARSRMMLSDEVMLKTTWQDVRDAAEGEQGTGPAYKPNTLTMVLLFALTAVSGFTLYMVMDLKNLLSSMGFGAGG